MKGLFAVVSILVTITSATDVDKCTDLLGPREGTYGSATIQDVRVSDCPDSPCRLRKGGETTIQFDFKSDRAYDKLTTNVFGGIGIIRVPFREVHGLNACKDIQRKRDGKKGCPLEANEVYTYSNTFRIHKSYPAVSVNVQYGLNDGKDSVICFTLPAKITNV